MSWTDRPSVRLSVSLPRRTPLGPTLEEVTTALRAGDTGNAQTLAIQALASGSEHPLLLNLRALDHETHGRLDEALADLTRAAALAPADFSILNARGLCLTRLERLDEAVAAFDAAIALQPRFAPARFNRGVALERLGDPAGAATAYEEVIRLDTRHVPALANLAWLASRRGDTQGAARFAEAALALQPGNPTAVMALAQSERDRPVEAEQRLRRLLATPDLAPIDRSLALGILGDALDGQGRPADAFAAYAQGNAIRRAELAPRFEAPGRRTIADTLAWLAPWAETVDARAWTAMPAPIPRGADTTGHVFLLGFPRSGTTLIESVLRAHPDVIALEERNTLAAATQAFMSGPDGLARLAATPSEALQPYRDDYWRIVRGFDLRPENRIFVDKNPFNTLKLPLIYKLFPSAKVVFAVRDPRDVVLSCFRRRFNANPSTYELLDLGRAAAFYDGAMRIAEALRQKQRLAEHRLVYERFVADFEPEARAVCDFIGADWRDDLADVAGRARRGEVASASAAQIARGVYGDGAGQWRHYANELAPVMPILAPWVRLFGYAA